MSLIEKKDSSQKSYKPKAKLVALVVGAFVSLSSIGGAYFFMEKDRILSEQASIGISEPSGLTVSGVSGVAEKTIEPALPHHQKREEYSIGIQESLDEVSVDISKRFFGGRLVEYIEYNKDSGLYALIPNGSNDVYYVNKDRTVVIKGDAYLISNSSATLINDSIKKSHKESYKGGVDVLSLVDGESNSAKKEAGEGGVKAKDNSLTVEKLQPNPEPNIQAQGVSDKNNGYVPKAETSYSPADEKSADSNNSADSGVLEKLANGEAVRPVREPTQEELDEIKLRTEEESAKILFGQKLKDDYLLVYNPPEGVRTVATINIFADPECPSCKKLHKDINRILSLGVKVRYIAMPRKGLDSSITKQMAVAFCSPNKQATFDSLFQGKRYDTNVDGFDSCFSLVSKNANLGYSLGIKHTPTIYSSDTGKVFEGYPSGEGAYISLLEQLGVTGLLGKK